MQKHEMNLVLSTDAKPRLKWTPELHQRFVEAVNQLGGAEKATPKSLMRVMGIPGLTLYHLKSHLQKYRLGKNPLSETCSDSKQDDYQQDSLSRLDSFTGAGISDATSKQMNESLQISQALQVQMEVQRKLYEQIEVQRHLQLRIEAQGKYLQKVLKKAQETLAGCTNSSEGVEHTKAELSQLVSMVISSSNSSFSELTTEELQSPSCLDNLVEQNLRLMRGCTGCSMDSSLTSSESSGRKEEDAKQGACQLPLVLPLFDQSSIGVSDQKRKRSGGGGGGGTIVSDGINFVDEQQHEPGSKRVATTTYGEKNIGRGGGGGLSRLELLETFDLNSQYQSHELDFGTNSIDIDLNSKAIEQQQQLNAHFLP